MQVSQLHLHLFAQFLIQCPQGFIQQHHGWAVDQGAGQGHPLLLPAGQLSRVTVGHGFHLHQPQGFDDAIAHLGRPHPPNLEPKGNVVFDGHVAKQRVALEYRIDRATVGRYLAHIGALD